MVLEHDEYTIARLAGDEDAEHADLAQTIFQYAEGLRKGAGSVHKGGGGSAKELAAVYCQAFCPVAGRGGKDEL